MCIYWLLVLPLLLLNLQPLGVASFFPGAPLDVSRGFSLLPQPLAHIDRRLKWGLSEGLIQITTPYCACAVGVSVPADLAPVAHTWPVTTAALPLSYIRPAHLAYRPG